MHVLRTIPLVLLLTTCALPAAAEPLALRHGGEDRALIVEGGWPNLSVGYWLGPKLGLAVDWRLPAAAISVSVGTRETLVHGPRHGGVDVFVSGGMLVPLIDPGLAVTATPAVQFGKRGPTTHVTLGFAAPLEFLMTPRTQLRAPVLLELRAGGNLGPFWIGLRGGVGPIVTYPGATGFTVQWSLWVRVPGVPRQSS